MCLRAEVLCARAQAHAYDNTHKRPQCRVYVHTNSALWPGHSAEFCRTVVHSLAPTLVALFAGAAPHWRSCGDGVTIEPLACEHATFALPSADMAAAPGAPQPERRGPPQVPAQPLVSSETRCPRTLFACVQLFRALAVPSPQQAWPRAPGAWLRGPRGRCRTPRGTDHCSDGPG